MILPIIGIIQCDAHKKPAVILISGNKASPCLFGKARFNADEAFLRQQFIMIKNLHFLPETVISALFILQILQALHF